MTEPVFTTITGRDASAVILGFFYQIELTIQHWLAIRDDETLELENGEDIDIVRRALLEPESSRILEQVKVRSAPISLRTPEVLECLVNFTVHRQNNPNHRLKFRFLTNSTAALERRRDKDQQSPGLHLWNAVGSGELDRGHVLQALKQLRLLISTAARPAKVSAENWDQFHAIVDGNDATALKFIGEVHWSLGHHETPRIGKEIERLLVEEGHVGTHAAESAHFRLVFYVLKRLSVNGAKTLTRAELFQQLTTADDLNVNAVLLRVVSDAVYRNEQLERIESGLQVLTSELAGLELSPKIRGVELALGSAEITTEAPPLVFGVCRRSKNIKLVLDALRNITWIHLAGPSGSGKTHFAILIAEQKSSHIWVDLRNVSDEETVAKFDTCLAVASGQTLSGALSDRYRDWVLDLAGDTTIIVDELAFNSGLIERLVALARCCAGTSVRIITTSAGPMAVSAKDYLGSQFLEISVPPFSDEEIGEYFSNRGAPSDQLDKQFLGIVTMVTRRHPQLLSAFVQYVVERSWVYDQRTIAEVMLGGFAEDLKIQIQRVLAKAVSTPTRELLYRLNVVGPVFNRTDVTSVSALAPTIALPMEKLNDCIGAWVQRRRDNTYLLSAPVSQLGSENLAPELRNQIHRYKATSILGQGKIDQIDVQLAIRYRFDFPHSSLSRLPLHSFAASSP